MTASTIFVATLTALLWCGAIQGARWMLQHRRRVRALRDHVTRDFGGVRVTLHPKVWAAIGHHPPQEDRYP